MTRTFAEVLRDGINAQRTGSTGTTNDAYPHVPVNGYLDVDALGEYVRDAYTLNTVAHLDEVEQPAIVHSYNRETMSKDYWGWCRLDGEGDYATVVDPALYLPALLVPFRWAEHGPARIINVETPTGDKS